MASLRRQDQRLLSLFLKRGSLRSSEVHLEMQKQSENVSLVTVKRLLSKLCKNRFLNVDGQGPSTTYTLSAQGRLFCDVDAREYCREEPDDRYGLSSYNYNLFSETPPEIFTDEELSRFTNATEEWKQRTSNVSLTVAHKEMERLVIELSWKSSRIEGNTYSLLDTERLILQNTEAVGHSKNEAIMILNHKAAFTLIHDHSEQFRYLTRSNLEHLHGVLTRELGVGKGLRKSLVGVTGSLYRPLDNVHQISDAVDQLSQTVHRMDSAYAKAMVALVGISYIQPFEDGNKRTSRLMANALLLANGCAPLSYRSVNEEEYREAMLVFYELNSVVPFKRLFLEQYEFAARHYAAK